MKSLKRLITNYKRWNAFEKKIFEKHQLPKYHPITGGKLDWYISIQSSVVYNETTGEPIQKGLATFKIKQRCPRSLRDHNVYEYNRHTKRIFQLKWLRWEGGI